MNGDIGCPRTSEKTYLTTQWRASEKPYDRGGVQMLDCYRDQFEVSQKLGEDGQWQEPVVVRQFDYPKLHYPLHVAFTEAEYRQMRDGQMPNVHKLPEEVLDKCIEGFGRAAQGQPQSSTATVVQLRTVAAAVPVAKVA